MNADAQRPDAYNKPLPLPHDDQPAYNGDDSHRPSQPAHTPGDYHTGMALNGRPGLQPIDTSALMPGDGMCLDIPDSHACNTVPQATTARH